MTLRNLTFVGLMIIPLEKSDQWTEVSYKKIPGNRISYLKEGIKINIEKSASPLVFRLPKTVSVQAAHLTLEFQGDLPPANDRWSEDAPFRIGFVAPGQNTLSEFKRWMAPPWVKQLFDLAPKGQGIDKIYFLNLDTQPSHMGQSRAHPHSKLLQEKVVGIIENSKSTYNLNYRWDRPQPTAALWISPDGDDTKSSFSVLIKKIELDIQE